MSILGESNLDNIEHLLGAMRNHRVVPFVGAGLSQPYGHRGWPAFLQWMAQESSIADEVARLLTNSEYAKAADALRDDLGRLVFEDRLMAAYGPKATHIPAQATAADYLPALSYLPHAQRCGPVVTTNFDRVLKRVFDAAGQPFEAEVWGGRAYSFHRALSDNEPFLLKIHGDVLDPTDRVFTLAEYEAKYSDGQIDRLLAYLFSSRSVLFLGCSLEADRVMEILHAQGASPHRHFAVLEMPADPARFAERKRFLSNHNIRPVWYPAGQHDQVAVLLDHAITATTTEPHTRDYLKARSAGSDAGAVAGVVQTLSRLKIQHIPYPPRLDSRLAEARFRLGARLVEQADFGSAVRELEQAVPALPDNPDLRATLATALVGNGEFPRALTEIDAAEKLGARLLDMTLLRALVLFAQRDFRKTVDQVTLAMANGYDRGAGHEWRCYAHIGDLNFRDALLDAHQAVSHRPKSVCVTLIPSLEATGFKGGWQKLGLKALVEGGAGMVSMVLKMGWIKQSPTSISTALFGEATTSIPSGRKPTGVLEGQVIAPAQLHPPPPPS